MFEMNILLDITHEDNAFLGFDNLSLELAHPASQARGALHPGKMLRVEFADEIGCVGGCEIGDAFLPERCASSPRGAGRVQS